MYKEKVLFVLVAVTAVTFFIIGCSGGHGPTLPSPDRPSVSDVIQLDTLVIPEGQTQNLRTNTRYEVAGIVDIAGSLVGADGTGAGGEGASIIIEAQGNISVTGLVRGGSGSKGLDRVGTDLGGAGGKGGTVSLTSVAGDITIGIPSAVAAAQASATRGVRAGNGGNGGDGLLGGPGGEGGTIELSAPTGTVTIHQARGLFHTGNGGHGGQGVVIGAAMQTFNPPASMFTPLDESEIGYDIDFDNDEFLKDIEKPTRDFNTPGHGGKSGVFLLSADQISGPTATTGTDDQLGAVIEIVFDDDVVTGGTGGDGGHFFYGIDPQTANSALASAASVQPAQSLSLFNGVRVYGTEGGYGFPTGGQGGDVEVKSSDGTWAQGGSGGNVLNAGQLRLVMPNLWIGGNGGNAKTIGADGPAATTPCVEGKPGAHAASRGGKGGDVYYTGSLPITLIPGNGGTAYSQAGTGGNAGNCCSPPGAGKKGGAGGLAYAIAGSSGRIGGTGDDTFNLTLYTGSTGSAIARGGNGGGGGDGATAGTGGDGGRAKAELTAFGQKKGSIISENGKRGPNGNVCAPPPDPVPTPDPGPTPGPPSIYGVVTSTSPQDRSAPMIRGMRNFFTYTPCPQQASPWFAVGGQNNPVLPSLGRTMLFTRNNSAMWVADEVEGIVMFANPLTGGDRPADRVFMRGRWRSIWYNEDRDILFASEDRGALLYAWDGASTGNPTRPADRTIEMAGVIDGAQLTGAPGSNRLFAATEVHAQRKILVYDNGHTISGQAAPNRIIDPSGGDFRTWTMAWDSVRDILYVVRMSQGRTIDVYPRASTLQGSVQPARSFTVDFPNMAAGDWISTLIAEPEHDLLFVGLFGGSSMQGSVAVYDNASSLTGTPTPPHASNFGRMILGLGVFKQ